MALRAAHFVQRYPPALGGSESFFARLSHALTARGDRVTVFTTAARDLEAFWSSRGACLPPGITNEDGVEVRRFSVWRWPGRRYLLKGLSLVPWRRLQCLTLPCNPIAPAMYCAAGKPEAAFDVVHATAFPYAWPIVCGLRLARRLRVPFLVTPFLHLGDPEDPHDRTRRDYLAPPLLWLLRQANRIFLQTEVECDALLERGFTAEKLVLLGMGVDPVECTGGDRDRVRADWGVAAADVVLGHLANNSEEKGSVDLLKAADLCWQRGQRFHLVLAGPEMPNFQWFWKSYVSASRVQRLGVVDGRQKRDFLAGLDVFALPSRSDSFGLVLLEAWANGVPNVAYRAGGIPGVIRDGIDGWLVRCGDVEGLATAMMRLIGDAAERTRLGMAGRDRLGRDFRWEDKIGRVREVYVHQMSLSRDAESSERSASRQRSAPKTPRRG